jgi:hypothetical protein
MDQSPSPLKIRSCFGRGERRLSDLSVLTAYSPTYYWSLVLATTVVRILLIVVNNLTKDGEKFFGRVILLTSEELPFCLPRFTTHCVHLSAIHIETLITLVRSKATTFHTRNHVSYQFTHSKILFSVSNTVYIIKGYVFNRKTGSRIRNF